VLGFFTCGFQLSFVTVHLPAYLVDRGLSADVGAGRWASLDCSTWWRHAVRWLGGRFPKRYILSIIYFTRAAAWFFSSRCRNPGCHIDLRRR